MTKPKKETKTKKSSGSIIWKIIQYIFIFFFSITIFMTLLYKWVNPPVTPLMIIRKIDKNYDIKKKWVDMAHISSQLPLAAVAAEDGNFLTHNGFDFKAIQKAKKNNDKGKRLRGGSTITQQVAKNVFLWPNRSYIRKGFETYFTVLIELFWSKERIMEVYLNVIEMGKGIYGCEIAAQTYFHKSAKSLSATDAALLTATYPNPAKRNPTNPSSYLLKYQNNILQNMAQIGSLSFSKSFIKKLKDQEDAKEAQKNKKKTNKK